MGHQHNYAEGDGIPLGLGMALAQNIDAMNRFASLPPEQKAQMISHTHEISSKDEMRRYVQDFAEGKRF